jgi:hypothetical protein
MSRTAAPGFSFPALSTSTRSAESSQGLKTPGIDRMRTLLLEESAGPGLMVLSPAPLSSRRIAVKITRQVCTTNQPRTRRSRTLTTASGRLPARYPIPPQSGRRLIKDRIEITAAQWRLDAAEAVLKLRALAGNRDYPDDYFACQRGFGLPGSPASGVARASTARRSTRLQYGRAWLSPCRRDTNHKQGVGGGLH